MAHAHQPLTEEGRRIKAEKCRQAKLGNKNPMWKNKVGYSPLHQWVKRHKLKPEFCECCIAVPPRDLANISQKYKRDIDDFEWLCRKCHMKKDGRIKVFLKYAHNHSLRYPTTKSNTIRN